VLFIIASYYAADGISDEPRAAPRALDFIASAGVC